MLRRTFLAAGLAATAAGLAAAAHPHPAAAAAPMSGPAHRFVFHDIDGGDIPLSGFAGKLVLVVNTASECAYTPQYQDLQALWQSYGSRGLVVLGVPSNDFGGQEPGDAAEIKTFCSGEYGVTFPLTEKEHVRGPQAHPFYAYAAATLGPAEAPQWNFHKYLVSSDGRIIDAWPSSMNPRDPRIVAAIEANLPR